MSTFQRKRVNWRWIDGEVQTFGYNVWADGEPGNYRGKEYCASYHPEPEAWFDEKCDRQYSGYVCQETVGKSELSTSSINHMPFQRFLYRFTV